MVNNRRDFLKKTTIAAAGISLSSSVNAILPVSFDGKFLSIYASDLTNEAKISGAFFDGSTEYVFKNINTH